MIRRLWLRLRKAVKLRKLFKWALVSLFLATLLLLLPVAYVEVGCRGQAATETYQPLITDPAFQRREANTYLTYPEWHIVFAYDGLAQALKTGDEHAFGYIDSITSFWTSACALTRVAGRHGGADWGTRSMIHTIGVSFTAEMLVKASYEETLGRATAWWRGPRKTPQDAAIAGIAADYAAFLRQTPWYEYPFNRKASELWAAPAGFSLRGWERRLGIGLEFKAKAVYAKVLAGEGDWQARGRCGDRDAALRPVHADPHGDRPPGRRDPRDRRQRRGHGERDRPRGCDGAHLAWNGDPSSRA
jgi:hypothetical protein